MKKHFASLAFWLLTTKVLGNGFLQIDKLFTIPTEGLALLLSPDPISLEVGAKMDYAFGNALRNRIQILG
ncbi:hypothetical protein [Arcticibacterium luteifluviistationis]|uniref:Uncharacterized protein n=1 Tax=Arcticibacterium luteifluviistationis TaxID=1784714 RepID=A0A2Z4G7E2_9BACT|nr:hypothetical protein [Arcticibacterium luteifluviistationis]AWV97084.1 hypothetical protein DJ013_02385 [Arcticibacterium luteifluviistationis]